MRHDNISDPDDPSDSCNDTSGTGDCTDHEAGQF